jgi:hypothetical protein
MKIINCIVIILIANGCCEFKEDDFKFSSDFQSILQPYNEGDTVFYVSTLGDMDTVAISTIDTFQSCKIGFLASEPSRSVSVEIIHLPNNNWIAGTVLHEDKPPELLNQGLVTIVKYPIDTSYYIAFQYRDFAASLYDLPLKEHGELLLDLGINEYWRINSDVPYDPQKENAVSEMIWSLEYGLTGYFKQNGEFYKIETVR